MSITQRLLRSTIVVSSMTLISRISGFIRDVIIAVFFGAAAGVDAFFVAFKIPNLMRRLFAEGAFAQAFVPILAEQQQKKSHVEVQQFVSNVAGTLAAILLMVTVLAVLFAPLLVMVFAPGFSIGSPRHAMASDMLRLTFPYLFFISLTAMYAAVLNTYGRFALPAFTPVLLNLCLIVCAIYLAPQLTNPVEALAWAVLLAGVLQLTFLMPSVRGIDLLTRPRFSLQHPEIRRILRLMVPALFGVSVAQINILIDMIFASFLPVGSISWLYFSDRLTQFPLGVFAVAIATVIMPQLSRDHADASRQQFSQHLDWALRLIMLIAFPATLGLIILSGPLLATLLGYGQFSDYDVLMAQLSLMTLSLGVPAFMLIKILASGFYAQQNIKTPVKIGVFAMLANSLLNLALIVPLQHAGLALATAISASLNAALLYYQLRKKQIYQPQAGWGRFSLQLLVANGAMAAALMWLCADIELWLGWSGAQKAMQLIGLVSSAALIYLLVLVFLGYRIKNLKSVR